MIDFIPLIFVCGSYNRVKDLGQTRPCPNCGAKDGARLAEVCMCRSMLVFSKKYIYKGEVGTKDVSDQSIFQRLLSAELPKVSLLLCAIVPDRHRG